MAGSLRGLAILAWLAMAGHPAQARDVLPASVLDEGSLRSPVAMDAFAPGPDAMPPRHAVEGHLRLSGPIKTRTRVADPDFVDRRELALARSLPQDLALGLVQDGTHVLPATRGPIASSHGWWQFLFEPGQAWSEPGDGGRTRVALPFALVQRNANCTHNGMLMFLLGDDGEVSQAALQVGSETCQYLQLDMWGLLAAGFTPGTIGDRAAVAADAAAERVGAMPSRSLEALPSHFPGLSVAALAVGQDGARTRHGLVVDGVHYASGCDTRLGPYPACDRLTLPSFSVAKTVVAAVALMRLEKLYPGTSALSLQQVSEGSGCRDEGWAGVRLLDLLDMATGHYDQPGYMADEDADKVTAFFDARTHARKLAFACEAYPRRQPPGQRWVYHTADTYLLGSALDQVLAAQPGRQGQEVFSDVLVPDVYAPIGLSQTARATRRTEDGHAQPFYGWGLFLRADDVAKLANFLGPARGDAGQGPVLDPRLLDEAMQRVPDAGGLQVAHLEKYRYQHGVWARDLGDELGCEGVYWVPFLSGFGGITVALFPNGVAWYSFADDGRLDSIDFAAPAREIAKIRPLCVARAAG